MASFTALRNEVFSREHRRQQYADKLLGLNAYERHKHFIKEYQQYYYGASAASSAGQKLPLKTDNDTLRETYRFIRTEEDDAERSWEQRLAKRYHEKLFKEYCIADMSRYKESRIGMRWRTEKEVISGKGQFECANKKCARKEGLRSYEVNFAYTEAGESKQALVKLRVCPKCSFKLNYRKEKELERKLRRDAKMRKRKRALDKSRKKSRNKSRERISREERSDEESGEESSDPEEKDSSDVSEDLEGVRRFRKTKSQEGGSDGGRMQETEGKDKEFEPFFKGMFL